MTGEKPSRAATIAKTPDPQPTSTRVPEGSGVSRSSSRHSRVVAGVPVPKVAAGSCRISEKSIPRAFMIPLSRAT